MGVAGEVKKVVKSKCPICGELYDEQRYTLSILEVYFEYTPSIPPVALPEYSRRGWGPGKGPLGAEAEKLEESTKPEVQGPGNLRLGVLQKLARERGTSS